MGDPAYDQKKYSVGIPMSRTKVITEEEAAASSEGVMKLSDGRLVQCMPSEYVLSLVAHPFISMFPASFIFAQSSDCEERGVSVMIQYSALSLRDRVHCTCPGLRDSVVCIIVCHLNPLLIPFFMCISCETTDRERVYLLSSCVYVLDASNIVL